MIGAERPEIQWDELDDSVTSVNAGLVTTLTSSFFEDYNNVVMDIFSEQIKDVELPDYCTAQSLGTIITGNLCVSNQKVFAYQMDKEDSKVQINSEKKSLYMRASGINVNFAFDYKVWSEPEFEWTKDEGTGKVSVANSDIDL